MTTIIILAMLSILAGVVLSLSGFTVTNTVGRSDGRQRNYGESDRGNMTGGNVTRSNTTEASGTVSHVCK